MDILAKETIQMTRLLKHAAAQETFIADEGEYKCDFLKWKGMVDANPILSSIIDAKWNAVTNSYALSGKQAETMQKILDNYTGNGIETFRGIVNNLGKIADIGGDSYAEIRYGDFDKEENVPVNLVILPPNNIKQHWKKGRIVKYSEVTGTTEWKPAKILHLCHDPLGAGSPGRPLPKAIENVLLHMNTLISTGSKVIEKHIKPTRVYTTRTDRRSEQQKIKDDFKAVNDTDTSDIFIAAGQIEKIETLTTSPYSTLNPKDWYQVLLDIVLMRCRITQTQLGTGTQTNEESATNQRMGVIEMISYEQQWLEEQIRHQLLTKAYPEDVPDIKFSYASEPPKEQFKMDIQTLQAMYGLPEWMPVNVKAALLGKQLKKMGLIQRAI